MTDRMRINAFGTRWWFSPTRDGELQVLDGYCRHMGGDLSRGPQGRRLACPFHDWRWNGATGRCVAVPYAKRLPEAGADPDVGDRGGQRPAAGLARSRGGTPPAEPHRPRRSTDTHEGHGRQWTWNSILIEGSHCREIVDNNVDMAHFFYIHHAYPTFFKNVFEGTPPRQFMESKAPSKTSRRLRASAGRTDAASEATYFGPSYMINWLHNDLATGIHVEVGADQLPLPGQPRLVRAAVGRGGAGRCRASGRARRPSSPRTHSPRSSGGLPAGRRDLAHKTRIENPLLPRRTARVYQHRRWYEQFYVDVAEVTADMTNRFEFEIDTTHANEFWQHEVAQNLAATVR